MRVQMPSLYEVHNASHPHIVNYNWPSCGAYGLIQRDCFYAGVNHVVVNHRPVTVPSSCDLHHVFYLNSSHMWCKLFRVDPT